MAQSPRDDANNIEVNNISEYSTEYRRGAKNVICHVCKCHLTSLRLAEDHFEGKSHKNKDKVKVWKKSGKPLPLHCDDCIVSFDGEVSALDHFNSQRHELIADLLSCGAEVILGEKNARKMKDKNGKDWFFCDVCRCPLNTSEKLKDHQVTSSHLLKLKEYLELEGSPTGQSEPSNYDAERDDNFIKVNDISEYITEYKKGAKNVICHFCKCHLTSLRLAEDHFEGKLHKNNVKVKLWKESGKLLPLHCDDCIVSFDGEVSALDHFNSQRHELMADLLSRSAEVIEGEKNARKMQDKNGKDWFFCDVCRCPLNTLETLKDHQVTSSHLKKLKE